MKVSVIPVQVEIDLKNPEQPLKVHYMVELTTSVYSDVMSSGMTYVSDDTTTSLITRLAEHIKNKIHKDLGLEHETLEESPTRVEIEEEDL